MTCPHCVDCVASGGAKPRHYNAAFRLGPRVPQWGGGDHRLWDVLVTPEHHSRIGPLTGLVEAEDIDGSPIARWPLDTHHHVDA